MLAGPLRVAVKMLKLNHSFSELSDLLSEYNLLKELDHPNVIKLLGVFTDRRGPVYLMMEFAKHGALRDYLRKSREYYEGCRTQSRSRSNTSSGFGSGISLEEEFPFIKQKDILGFAWQISKGMSYLAKMKVCHSVTYYCSYQFYRWSTEIWLLAIFCWQRARFVKFRTSG